VRLLLDEMYPATVAEQLRARGHDVVSIHDPAYRRLEGSPDEEVFATAIAESRVLVTENVPDFRLLEAEALASRIGVPPERIRLAIRYYGEYPEEVDSFIALVEEETERLEQALEHERRLLE